MNDLLFLCHRIPYPPDKGDKIRAWHMLRLLSRHFHVHLGCFVDDAEDLKHVPMLAGMCRSIKVRQISPAARSVLAMLRARPGIPLTLSYYRDKEMQDWVDARIGDGISNVFVFCASVAPLVARPGLETAHRVLDMVDVDSEKWAQYARKTRNPIMRALWSREARCLSRYEQELIGRFSRVLLCSRDEVECLLQGAGIRAAALAPSVDAVENGVDLDFFDPNASFGQAEVAAAEVNLVFTGAMDYRPNIEAVIWFAREVLPMLNQDRERFHFTIVGTRPHKLVLGLRRSDISVTGRVEDIRPWLKAADIVVAPLQIARGIQNKLLEAMAMARPVVASPEAFTGLQAERGRDILVAKDAVEMAACIRAIADGAHGALGRHARKAMLQHYGWAERLAPILPLFGLPMPGVGASMQD